MKIEALENEKTNDFVEYCKKYRREIDDSFLCDEDLRDFDPDDENPTYIMTNQQGEIKAVASLMVSEYNKRGRNARFRIFHSEIENIECYNMLMQAILKHTEGLDKLFIFIPTVNKKLIRFIEELRFTIDRYSFLLIRDEIEIPEFNLPEEYNIRPFRLGYDEEAWCQVRNTAFAKLKGSETPITPEMVPKMICADDNIDGGAMILFHKEKPVGVVRGSKDEHEDLPIMNIGPIAILPEYQGKGLGRALLRASLKFAKETHYDKTILCVNADNERAKRLYIQEGFNEAESVACYRYDLI